MVAAVVLFITVLIFASKGFVATETVFVPVWNVLKSFTVTDWPFEPVYVT